MKRLFFFMILMFIAVELYAQPGRIVIDRQEMRNAGVLTMNDLFELSGQWEVSSVDDFTLLHSRNGLAGPGGMYWPVFLNDIPLDLNVWGTKNLNKIPVSVSAIDSVVLVTEPQLAGGMSMEKGGVFIYTKSRREGISADAELWTGNRTGDPGPFVYTERATPNVERLGPIASASVSYAKDRFSVEGGMKRMLHFVSEPIQGGRILPLAYGDDPFRHPKIELQSFYVRGSHTGETMNHSLQAGASDVDDFLYTELYGTEIPAGHSWSFVSLDGGIKAGENTSIRYRVSHNRNETNERENKENLLLRWNRAVTGGQISVSNDFEFGSLETGAGYDHYIVNDGFSDGDALSVNLLKLFNRLRLELSSRLTSYIDLMAVKGEGDRPVFKSFTNMEFTPVKGHRLTAGFTYSERLPEEDNSLWYWIGNKGFGGDRLSGNAGAGIPGNIRLLRGHLAWNMALTEALDIKSGVGISRYLDEYAPAHRLVSREDRYVETGTFSFHTNLNAVELTIPAELSYKPSGAFTGTVGYTWNRLLSGSSFLWDRSPGQRFHGRLNWNPVNSFNIWTTINFRSITNWNSVGLLDGETLKTSYGMTDVTYRSTLPGRVRWDAGFSKKIWDDRVAFRLQVNNLLNDVYREHPLGPKHSFTIFLGMSIHFD